MSLRDHLQDIYDSHGQLTPAIVVEVARNESHPLHALVFDRVKEDAAEAWYLERAQRLIQRVKITYRKDERRGDRTVRAFQSVRSSTGYSYEPVEAVVADEEMLELVLREMEREWRTLRRRYQHLAEFAAMVNAESQEMTEAA